MANHPKILMLIRQFGDTYPKHNQKYKAITYLEKLTDVHYWHEDGSILDILKKIPIKPDFILHYDPAWGHLFAPHITDLDKVSIPTGAFSIDVHANKQERLAYFTKNKVNLIFSVIKSSFLNTFPQFEQQFRWLPFSIDPSVTKDWQLKKDIKFLFMGLVNDGTVSHPPLGRYPFREAVLKRMKDVKGFKYNKHPGNLTSNITLVNETFSQELNRAEIFFTCGGAPKYPVMKFFEAPGSRTLLLAEPNDDVWDLGFKDGESFAACSAEDFYDKAMYYSQNEVERERVTMNGYSFIHDNHTNAVRAQQLLTYITDYLGGKETNNLPFSRHDYYNNGTS
ncbi:glycosyltransferase [Salipaludibacillus sp. LMS25]|uniref:glycosyltransferase n=1 Tax=Salipaludibacillus sp. LMS25 TaxID=2924031 RepID=UPI0020D1F125|nr:glycosyltransferase [Salipaludibacillus sp. LMS25]UTR13714.1 glycosyltransferase [Salipaludibacillus sp. LMS25]